MPGAQMAHLPFHQAWFSSPIPQAFDRQAPGGLCHLQSYTQVAAKS